MKKEKKQLLKNFKLVIDDLLDNYELYTDFEKEQIKEVFQKVAELNKTLDKYDLEGNDAWLEYIANYNKYFGSNEY